MPDGNGISSNRMCRLHSKTHPLSRNEVRLGHQAQVTGALAAGSGVRSSAHQRTQRGQPAVAAARVTAVGAAMGSGSHILATPQIRVICAYAAWLTT